MDEVADYTLGKVPVTMRIDVELLKFADDYAMTHKTTRTQLITDILVIFKAEIEAEKDAVKHAR